LTLPVRQLLPSITAGTEPDGSTEAGVVWSIDEVARMSKVTSRTLRHYDDVGLLRPAYVGSNGYRYYEQEQLLRLQQVLLLQSSSAWGSARSPRSWPVIVTRSRRCVSTSGGCTANATGSASSPTPSPARSDNCKEKIT